MTRLVKFTFHPKRPIPSVQVRLGFMEGFDRPSDGRLVRYIRETWLVPPSTRQAVKKSSWWKERHFSQVGQSQFVDKALRKRTGK